MKVIFLRDKSKYYIEDDVADKIINNINQLKFIKLPTGDFINITEIIKITEPEKKPYFIGFPMTDDLNYVIRQGQKVPFDKAYTRDIQWKVDLPEELQPKQIESNDNN
jgi:hypothetical protein